MDEVVEERALDRRDHALPREQAGVYAVEQKVLERAHVADAEERLVRSEGGDGETMAKRDGEGFGGRAWVGGGKLTNLAERARSMGQSGSSTWMGGVSGGDGGGGGDSGGGGGSGGSSGGGVEWWRRRRWWWCSLPSARSNHISTPCCPGNMNGVRLVGRGGERAGGRMWAGAGTAGLLWLL